MAIPKQLLELNDLAMQDAKKYLRKRDLYSTLIAEKGKHFVGIAGPRGVGKTILLKQLALAWKDSFYLSADAMGDEDLFEIAKDLAEKYKTKTLLIDEIHFQKEYDAKLKKIFDFLDIRVVFTSSVSLSLYESAFDLSRRVRLSQLYPFSFGEFISFKKGEMLPALSLEDILQEKWQPSHLRYEYMFDEYLKGGLMPFALEEPDVLSLAKNILSKVISRDIPTVGRLMIDELAKIEKLVAFVGKSGIDDINYTSLSKNIGITKHKAESYVKMLEKAFILNPVLPTGTNVLKEPKVLMHLPYRLLFRDFGEAVGGLREDFFAETMRAKNIPFHYLKSTRGEKTPDYLIEQDSGRLIIEIGGKGKGREQFKGIEAARKLVFSHGTSVQENKRPLFLLGYL